MWPFNRKRHKKDLREKCRELYGDDFLVLYDTVCAGGTIGNLSETIIFTNMVENARTKLENGE